MQTLNQLKALLPGDTPIKVNGEYDFELFDQFVYNDEPELALEAIVYIAEAHVENGTIVDLQFWMTAKQLADHLIELNRKSTYFDGLADTIETIEMHCASKQP